MEKILCLLASLCILISCTKEKSNEVVVYQDPLTTDNGIWPVDSTKIHIKKFYEGHYLIEVDSVPNMISLSLAPDSITYSYSVQVDATVEYGSTGTVGITGIIFNWTDKNNYCVAEVTSKGNFRIWERVDGSIERIDETTASPEIHTGNLAKNTIKVIQNEYDGQLIVNGKSIISFDISLPDDIVRVGFETSSGPDPVKGLFNNFIIEKLNN